MPFVFVLLDTVRLKRIAQIELLFRSKHLPETHLGIRLWLTHINARAPLIFRKIDRQSEKPCYDAFSVYLVS